MLNQPPILCPKKVQLLDTKVEDERHINKYAQADDCKHAPAVMILHVFTKYPVCEEDQMKRAQCNDGLVKQLNIVLKSGFEWSEIALVNKHKQVDVEHSKDMEYLDSPEEGKGSKEHSAKYIDQVIGHLDFGFNSDAFIQCAPFGFKFYIN